MRVDESPTIRSLTIIIPAYNEARRIGPSLEKIVQYASGSDLSVDLLVVDDGSTDGTADVVRETVAGRMPLRVVTNDPNRGKGYSVRRGLLEASGDCVLFSDADLSTPIEEADHLLAAIREGADVAIGSRSMKGSHISVHQPWWREKAGKLFGLMVRLLVLPGIQDSQCGFKCFRAEAARRIAPLLTLDGWAFDVELLLVARRMGCSVAQVPVEWRNDPNTKVRMLTDGPRMLADMLRARWRVSRLPLD
jgi:dolichyl-phosphate beta-glucosyltransferase